MGARLGYRTSVHIRRGFLGWGVFLILAGAVPLAVRAGYLDEGQVGRLWTLWPLILIGIGVSLILRRTRLDFLGGLIVAATLGLMIGGLLSVSVAGFAGGTCGQGAGTTAFPSRGDTFLTAATINVQSDCGDLNVAITSGDAWQLSGTDADGVGPSVERSISSLDIRSRNGQGPFAFGDGDVWQLTLPTGPHLDLDIKLNAGSSEIGLGRATISRLRLQINAGSSILSLAGTNAIDDLDVQLNAGSLRLTLPNVSLTGTIQANAGSVKLCAPQGAALRLHTGDSIIASYDYAGHGLVEEGSTWSTPGFDSAAVRIELDTRANAGSFVLDPADGCG